MFNTAGEVKIAAEPPAAMHLVQVIGTLDIASAGTTYSVTRLSQAMATNGATVDLMTAGRPRHSEEGRFRVRVYPRDLARVPGVRTLYLSRGLDAALSKAVAGAVLHVHGLWSMPTIYPARHARRFGAPLVQSPRGMLAPAALAFSASKKKLFAAMAQRRALQAVTCFHATSREEVADIRAYGLDAPVAVIPNGIDIPALDLDTSRKPVAPRTLLYLGRLHPIKGLDRLLEAWARIQDRHPEWRLRIVGPSEGTHRVALETAAVRLKLVRVSFEDGLYGDAKLAALQAADLLVLPTRSENFAIIVAEALAAGLPVVTTTGAPWRGLVEHRCGWWIDHGVELLATTLAEAMAMPREALATMGARGRTWMARDFAWERIAADMLDVYRWCTGQGNRPGCVVVHQ